MHTVLSIVNITVCLVISLTCGIDNQGGQILIHAKELYQLTCPS